MRTLEITPELRKKVEEFGAIRRDKYALERREKDLKAEILEFAKNKAASLNCGDVTVAMVTEGLWTGIDQDMLRDKFPKAHKACTTSKPYFKIELAR